MIQSTPLSDYLREQALNQLDLTQLQIAVMTLSAVLQAEKPVTTTDCWQYPVPVLRAEGLCSLTEGLAPEPYDLVPVFGDKTPEAEQALRQLHALLHSVNAQVQTSWLGVYVKVGKVPQAKLIKLAYQGCPSRAEFPLNEDFATQSVNSRVGLTGWAMLLDDVVSWQAEEGGYYVCDPKVQSEFCLPVLGDDDNVLGIVDAESTVLAYFTPERQVWLVALAIVLAPLLRDLPLAGKSKNMEN